MQHKFVADRNLGKLAKWLRILGYDTVYERSDADGALLRRARAEGRIVLTRKRNLAGHAVAGSLVVVKADRVESQIGEVLMALNIVPDPAGRMTRCLHCNAPLKEIPQASVEGFVPAYIFSTHTRFHRCPGCGRVFWPGTHTRHMEDYLRTRVSARHSPLS